MAELKLRTAARFLLGYLDAHSQVAPSADVKWAAEREGISLITLHRARKWIGVEVANEETFPRRTMWLAPDELRREV